MITCKFGLIAGKVQDVANMKIEQAEQFCRGFDGGIIYSFVDENDLGFPVPDRFVCEISFPFDAAYMFGVDISLHNELADTYLSLGRLVWECAYLYSDMYTAPNNKYGVWGHTFDELYFEEITIREDGKITVFVEAWP